MDTVAIRAMRPQPRLISKYLNRELFLSFLGITGILLLIFMSQQFMEYVTRIAAGKLPGLILFKLMGLHIPYLLGILCPLGLFLAVLLTLGKHYANQELTVLHASGMSTRALFRLMAPVITFVILLTCLLNFWITPKLLSQKYQLLSSTAFSAVVDTLTPGRFKAIEGGRRVIYTQEISRNRQKMRGIFIAEQMEPASDTQRTKWRVLTADKAQQQHFPTLNARYIVAKNGQLVEGLAGEKAIQLASFTEYGIKEQNTPIAPPKKTTEGDTTTLLMKTFTHNHQALAEFIWRLNLPLSALGLAWLAIVLGRLAPRQSRYAKLFPGILAYTLYANLLYFNRAWINKDQLSWWLCLLITHGLLLLLIAYTSRDILKERLRRKAV